MEKRIEEILYRKKDKIGQILEKKWPDYQLGEVIGMGSYGTVYDAARKDDLTDSHWAIKVIRIPKDEREIQEARELGYSDETLPRYFQQLVNVCTREIKMMYQVKDCANIVSIEDCTAEKDPDEEMVWYIFIRMPRLISLKKEWGNNSPAVTETSIIKLGIDICKALEFCHGQEKPIIHRDIKPENILMDTSGHFLLTDFGIAQIMQRNYALSMKGTPNTAAPELWNGSSITDNAMAYRVDIYSLGMVLYYYGNGRRYPFYPKQVPTQTEAEEALSKRLQGNPFPMPEQISPGLWQVIQKATAYRPENRYASVFEMRKALEGLENGVQPLASDRKRPMAALAVLGIILGVAALWYFGTSNKPAPEPESIYTKAPILEASKPDPEAASSAPETSKPSPAVNPSTPEPANPAQASLYNANGFYIRKSDIRLLAREHYGSFPSRQDYYNLVFNSDMDQLSLDLFAPAADQESIDLRKMGTSEIVFALFYKQSSATSGDIEGKIVLEGLPDGTIEHTVSFHGLLSDGIMYFSMDTLVPEPEQWAAGNYRFSFYMDDLLVYSYSFTAV